MLISKATISAVNSLVRRAHGVIKCLKNGFRIIFCVGSVKTTKLRLVGLWARLNKVLLALNPRLVKNKFNLIKWRYY